ncbi:dynein regulatory complex subunit 4-like isoform X2 [Homarus americanus]|uniref:dynein regulatory complex subunit 4-like isoform X2 n=1 Tax=Homarus americanus TaxID=6706 RepID=UPI001C470BEF|nr:dynein regulatory complex subunit 4-like isoform X2 [Homarus americanus]
MPPKKKGDKAKGKRGSKKTGSGRAQTLIDGIPINTMSKEQLEGHVIRLRSELEREREERNYVQSELERVQRLWQVAAENIDNMRAELRHKDVEIGEAEEKHQQEISVYQQKMKHLMFTQENTLTQLQVDSEQALLNLHQDSLAEENHVVQEREDLRAQLRETESNYLAIIANMKVAHSKSLDSLREEFEKEAAAMEAKSVKRIKTLQNQLDLKRKTELIAQEEKKNNFLATIISNHEKTFEEMKKYYTDITATNLKLITELKAELAEQKEREHKLEQEMSAAVTSQTRLEDEVTNLRKKLSDTQRTVQRSQRDKESYMTSQAQVKVLTSKKEALQWELEVLRKKAEMIEQERKELYDHFVGVVGEVQQRSELRNIVLEKRLNQTIVDEKNQLVGGLQEEVATLRRMYTELMDKYHFTLRSNIKPKGAPKLPNISI